MDWRWTEVELVHGAEELKHSRIRCLPAATQNWRFCKGDVPANTRQSWQRATGVLSKPISKIPTCPRECHEHDFRHYTGVNALHEAPTLRDIASRASVRAIGITVTGRHAVHWVPHTTCPGLSAEQASYDLPALPSVASGVSTYMVFCQDGQRYTGSLRTATDHD